MICINNNSFLSDFVAIFCKDNSLFISAFVANFKMILKYYP
jgi:hypothetical protein